MFRDFLNFLGCVFGIHDWQRSRGWSERVTVFVCEHCQRIKFEKLEPVTEGE